VSTPPVRYPKPQQSSPARKRVWVAVVAVWGLMVLVLGWAVAEYGGVQSPAQAGAWLANAADDLGAWSAAWASPAQVVSAAIASPRGVYRNPLRGVSGLVPERIDDGVDFAGIGPVYALGDAVVTNATGTDLGWPGGGWITYRLTGGPASGLVVYVAEDITPAVTVGQRVSPSTVIGTMFDGSDGIETGWAQPTGLSAESELPQAGGIAGLGPFPTRIGVNFDELLQLLGVPAAPNRTQLAHGLLPAGYPASW
jgi:murein DD-endopeptidase MepM/ murein hydrolase activator NlpD